MQNDDLIAALERVARLCDIYGLTCTISAADAARIRDLAVQIQAGQWMRRKNVIMELLDTASLYDRIDDGLSGYDKIAQGLREFAEELEAR